MAIRILTDEQRARYGRFTGTPAPDTLARYFHLDTADLDLIQGLRGEHNRLGFAVMLGSARCLGTFLDQQADIPGRVLHSLSRQLNLPAAVTLDGYFVSHQRERHLQLIRQRYGFSEFLDEGGTYFRLARWLYARCWSGEDRAVLLFEQAVEWLLAHKVLLPGVTVLERFVGRVRDRAQRRLWRKLIEGLSAEQRRRIDLMFTDNDPDTFSALEALRTVPTRRSPTEFVRHLDRLDAIRAFDLRPVAPRGVPPMVIERLARVARQGKPSAIVALQEPRRTATIAALFYTLEAAAQDDAAELAEALMVDLNNDAEASARDERSRNQRELDAAAILLRELTRMVLEDDGLPLDRWREALFERIPREELDEAVQKIDAMAMPSDAKPYPQLRKRWRRAKRLFFEIATRVQTAAAPNGEPVREAVEYLKGVPNWAHAPMRDAPTTAIPNAWRPYVLDENERVVDPKAYVFSIIDAWRTAIKRRDVFTEPGARYGDPRRGLLEGTAWSSSQPLICRALNRSLDADLEIEGLTRLLDTAYREVNSRIDTNPDLRIEKVDGKAQIIVTPLDKLEEPDSLKALRAEIARRMPRVDLPDVVLEIMGRTGFANAFTHLSERQARVEDFATSLGAALVATGCNIGFAPMIQESIPALRRERLSWVRQNFLRADTLSAGGAILVAAHNALPLVAHWGAGDVASADGMRFIAPASAIHAGPNPKYFGQGRGLTWNNLLSNQFSGLNGLVVPGTLRDSLVLLALLLEQETEIEPLEIMTDTASYSDAVFALFWLLGYQFSPRLADIGGARLWRIDRKADYGQFNALTTGSINVELIRENWPDLIRLAGSLKLGHLKAAGVMRTLQVKDNPTTLARALAELGRIIKSLHVLRYVDDAAFRRRILTQLNRQELRHRLGRRIFLGERGEIRSSLRQGQEEELGAMGLLLNVVVHWNAIYMQEVITQLKTEGWVIEDADLARLSPLIWRHINFLGRYNFAVPEVVANGGLRPLSNPSSEWDF